MVRNLVAGQRANAFPTFYGQFRCGMLFARERANDGARELLAYIKFVCSGLVRKPARSFTDVPGQLGKPERRCGQQGSTKLGADDS